jgi:ankyrin repeat protein
VLASTLLMVSGIAAATVDSRPTGDSRLVEAARNHDLKTIRSLLGQHINVNGRSDDGSTALLWAAHQNDLDTADLLLAAGADANAANDFRMTPLSQACTNGSDAFVRLLLKSGANPNTAIATGVTPLMTCAKSGSVDVVKRLVEYGAAIEAKEPDQHQTALMWAAAEHQLNVAQALIDAHADLKAHSKAGFTAMHFAARQGDQEMVQLLLAAGVNVNILSQAEAADAKTAVVPARGAQIGGAKTAGVNGYTPLLVATVRGNVPLALFLLDHGADPNIGDAGITPLHWASTEWETYTANRVYG